MEVVIRTDELEPVALVVLLENEVLAVEEEAEVIVELLARLLVVAGLVDDEFDTAVGQTHPEAAKLEIGGTVHVA